MTRADSRAQHGTWVALLATIATLTLSACGSDSHPANPAQPSPSTVAAVTVASTSTSASSIQLSATARMTDGSTRDVTTSATWESSNPALGAISAAGTLTILGTGELDVRATYQGVTGSLHLLVTKLPVVSVSISGGPSTGSTQFQLTATARMSDGSTQDVSRSASWASSDTTVATVSSTGFVTIIANGAVDIRATYQGITGIAHFNVGLPTQGTLHGVVTDAASAPIAGVRVQIIGGGSTTTDAQGTYTITVPEGRALVEFSKQGYQTIEKDIVVSGDTQLNVTLAAATS